jgi:hypothetical protein
MIIRLRHHHFIDSAVPPTHPLRMRIGLLLIAISTCLSANSVLAERHDKSCTAATATSTSIDTVQKDFKDWSGRCVRFTGLAMARHLFVDRQATLNSIDPDKPASDGSIRIYSKDSIALPLKPTFVELIGTLGSCIDQQAITAALQKQEPNMIIMTSGLCHSSSENYVDPISIVVTSKTPVPRLTEKEVPTDRRRLIDAPADMPGRARVIAAARAAVAALSAGDEAAFLKLNDPETAHDMVGLDGKAPEKWLQEDIDKAYAVFHDQAGSHGPFASVHLDETSQERVFIDRRNLNAKMSTPQETPSLIVCWCKTADCAGKWPVAFFDADNEPERPYACARTYEDVLGPNAGTAIEVDTTSRPNGFAEREWSKYRAAR